MPEPKSNNSISTIEPNQALRALVRSLARQTAREFVRNSSRTNADPVSPGNSDAGAIENTKEGAQ